MADRAALEHLHAALSSLADQLSALGLVVDEDRPKDGHVALADRLTDTIDEMRGTLKDAGDALRDVPAKTDVSRATRALVAAHKVQLQIVAAYLDLASAERGTQLTAIARERGAEWQGWARAVTAGIDACQAPLLELNAAVQAAWEELAERFATGS